MIELTSGTKIPQVGCGTWCMEPKDEAAVWKAVSEVGYRHIDTAANYGMEEAVGNVVKRAEKELGLKREDFYITTKLWRPDMGDPEAAIKHSLKMLQMDYVDLYLIHWPLNWPEDGVTGKLNKHPMHKIWAKMEELQRSGLTRAIGISNFNV